jgi:hypothetical protein
MITSLLTFAVLTVAYALAWHDQPARNLEEKFPVKPATPLKQRRML